MTKQRNPRANGAAPPTLNAEQLKEFGDIIGNALMIRQEMFRSVLDPRRDIDDECGYPWSKTSSALNTVAIYQKLFDQEAVAARVVECLPRESWQVQPKVYEKEEGEEPTEFEQAWDDLARNLRGEESFYQDEKGSPIWEYLERVDEQSGIGHFGVLLIGVDDGKGLADPVEGMPLDGMPKDAEGKDGVGQMFGTSPLWSGTDAQYVPIQFGTGGGSGSEPASTSHRKLLYLRVFPESLAQIVQYEGSPANPRFGQPVRYWITLNDPNEQHQGVGLPNATVQVHWTRVLHVADNRTSSEVFGVPRMRSVLNRLLDLRKLYGGSAEMYWRGAFPGYSVETHPQMGGDAYLDPDAIRDTFENWANGLQRYFAVTGAILKSQAPQVVDPTPQINTQLEAICIKLGIPKRVFMGSERGELASSQDDAAWNDRLKQRQNGYITPRIIVPFIDRLIAMGVLPEPGGAKVTTEKEMPPFASKNSNPPINGKAKGKVKGKPEPERPGYSIEWPDLTSHTDAEKADVAVKETTALTTYVSAGGEQIMAPFDYLTRILGMEEEEAQAVIDATEKHVEETQAVDMDKQQEMIDKGLAPDPTQPKVAVLPPGADDKSGAVPFGGGNRTPKPNPFTKGGAGGKPTFG